MTPAEEALAMREAAEMANQPARLTATATPMLTLLAAREPLELQPRPAQRAANPDADQMARPPRSSSS
jgi:hypothetical protein